MEAVPWLWKLLFLLFSFFFCSPVLATLEQGAILQEVKNSGWITIGRPSWTPGTDPCVSVWEGVDCGGGDVILLNLTHTGLYGPVPEALGRLTTLALLDMGNNKLCKNCSKWNHVTGDLASIANLVNLEFLSLTSNELRTSTFPSAIFKLQKLVTLRVDNTLVAGGFPAELSSLHNLQYLYLGNNTFTGTIPRDMWRSLTNLRELTFWGNKLSGIIPPEIGLLVNLTYLNMNRNALYGGLPPEIGNLVSLQRIVLYQNQLTGPLPDTWRAMTSLRDFELNTNFLYGTLPTWLLQLPKISLLHINNNQLYGSLIPVLSNSTTPGLKDVLLNCNYFQGNRPTVESNISANLENNCWNNEPVVLDLVCGAQNCFNFQLYTGNGTRCPACPSGQHLVNTTTCICYGELGHTSKKLAVGAIVGVALGAAFLLLLLLCYFFRRRKEQPDLLPSTDYFNSERAGSVNMVSLHDSEVPGGVLHFTLDDLKKATKGFGRGNLIGEGSFGKVFLGNFPDGKTLAIKRAGAGNSLESDHGQFRNEVLLLSRLHHKNLVRLEGFCDDNGQQILVYEYMKFGNLHSHLHGSHGKYMILDWYKRLEIAVNVAQGLDYLHSFADPPVIHRDVKPTNILLDQNLVAKVADFGISKETPEIDTHVSTRPAGTAGYFDPQYFLRRQLTPASDVYSFGVVLLELISGRKAIEFNCSKEEESNIIEWTKAKMELGCGGIESVVDSKLEGKYPRELYVALVELGLKCSSFQRNIRPTMKSVLSTLEPLLQEVEKPPERPLLSSWPSQLPPYEGTHSSTASFIAGYDDLGYIQGLHSRLEPSTRIELNTEVFPR